MEDFVGALNNIIWSNALIFLCLGVGMFFQKAAIFPPLSHRILNQFVIYVSVPAIALYFIPEIVLTKTLFFPLGIAWIGFGLSYLFFSTLQRLLGWSNSLTGCLILTGGLGNTSFVGFPVIEALFGQEGLQTAIIVDQPGSFVVLATLGVTVASVFSKGEVDSKAIIKKILFFPPFIAFVLACLLNVLNIDFPNMLQTVFQKVGGTVSTIALVSVGLQLKIDKKSQHWNFLALGLFFKLMLTPLFFLVLYKFILSGEGLIVNVSIMESAMAPMITGAILASTYGLKPKLSSMMIGIGIPLSFLTLAFWYWLLSLL